MDYKEYALSIAKRSKNASYEISNLNTHIKNNALRNVAKCILEDSEKIIKENSKDVDEAIKSGKNKAFIDRLVLDQKKIKSMVKAIEDIIGLNDPVGSGNQIKKMPNELTIMKVRVPIGVVLMIYESRPNVTSDAFALTLKSGNSVILRGGKESVNSNIAIANSIKRGLRLSNLSEDAIIMIEDPDKRILDELLLLNNYIDVVIPRGGEALIKAVSEKSRIPIIKHDKGVCHVFIDDSADKEMAERITVNAKVQRPSVCNAIETLLIHKDYPFKKELIEILQKNNVEIIGDENIQKLCSNIIPAKEEDWWTEYLDYKISVRVVKDVYEAVEHINYYGSHHSDSIVSKNYENIQYFLSRVDSAAVYANASTRFTDGGEFGLGAEMGISTQKLHVRGPMGLEGLTTEKWIIYGNGQIRE